MLPLRAAPRDVPTAIATRTCHYWRDHHGIVHAVIKPGVDETLDDARENVAASARMFGGTPQAILIDSRGLRSQTREARAHYTAQAAGQTISAAAILVASPLTRIIANFYMGLGRGAFPTKTFTSEAEAIFWLRRYA
jgi:hypothetical protein